ncbi:MAG: ion transporter [Nanoarchaeota archaeon]|nr:ion transporter [Nanoarchaeota archaeon]
MKPGLHKIEVIVDKSIPYLLIALLFIITGELFFHEQLHHYQIWIDAADSFIISVFVFDLVFKYIRIRNIPKFLKSSWLDIIAVFPFFLLFRLFEEIGLLFSLGERIAEAQPIFHESVEIEKEASKIIRESEKLGKVSRAKIVSRFIRPLARVPRFFKAFAYFERPTGKHHIHEKK